MVDAICSGERLPTLTHAQEEHLFLRFNLTRMKIASILHGSAGKRLLAETTRELLAWGHRMLAARSVIVRLNMPLVLAMAKRTRLGSVDFNELISEGNMALLRSVEKFDCSRGYKFSTYSCRAILKSFSRVAMRASRYRGKFPAEFDPAMERSDFIERQREGLADDCVDELKEIFLQNLAGLSDVERTVISERLARCAERRRFDPGSQDVGAGRADHRRDQGAGAADSEQCVEENARRVGGAFPRGLDHRWEARIARRIQASVPPNPRPRSSRVGPLRNERPAARVLHDRTSCTNRRVCAETDFRIQRRCRRSRHRRLVRRCGCEQKGGRLSGCVRLGSPCPRRSEASAKRSTPHRPSGLGSVNRSRIVE